MARIELNIRFFYEDALYADTLGYIPRHEAIKIPQLKIQEREQKPLLKIQKMMPVQQKSTSKNRKQNQMEQFENDQQMDENEDQNMEMDVEEAEGQAQNEGEIDEMEEDEQQDLELMENENENQNEQNQFEDENDNQNEEGDEDDEQIDDSNDDLSQFSRSPNLNYSKYKTKRQKGQLDKLLELPLKKPRKDAKKFDEATELIRKQEKERKRRQYIKKMNEAQQKATFDKILNETGRKFRQREQKQQKEVKQKDGKIFKTLGNVPKIITKQTSSGSKILLNRTSLFKPQLLIEPNIRMSEACSVCHQAVGKYKTKTGDRFCSVLCFKEIEKNQKEEQIKQNHMNEVF